MKSTYLQYAVDDAYTHHRISIYTSHGWNLVRLEYATAADVRRMLGVSRSTAYRIMEQLPVYEVIDKRPRKQLKITHMVSRADLTALERAKAGNPGFRQGDYQAILARRPRHRRKKLDR